MDGGIPAPEYVPERWDGPHVGKRLVDGLRTLMLMPKVLGPRSSGSLWPSYAYDRADLLAQQEADEEQKMRAHREQNRTRLRPSSVEIAHMEQAICWPARYLRESPKLVLTVMQVAAARTCERDMEDAAKRLRLPGRLVRRWNGEGVALIAKGLIQARIRVF